jgi:hypothetical protein
MAHLSSKSTRRSIDVESPGVYHFLRTPLEIRDEIYGMLLTTQYCTHISPTGTSLEFQLSISNILRANKQIYVEATRVFLKKNDFIILKVLWVSLPLKDVPAFKFLREEKVTNPVLRVNVRPVRETRHRNHARSTTLITTIEGLQPIITAL